MDLALIVILAIVIVVGIIVYRSTAPKALEVLDKPVDIVPESSKTVSKKPRAKAAPKPVAKTATATKTVKNSSKSRKPKA